MEEAILSLPEQLTWSPVIDNQEQLRPADKFVLAGMGGSALAGGLLRVNNPVLDLLTHRDYDLPRVPDYFLREALIVCVSYSGQTAETISSFERARAEGLAVAVVTSGGRLLTLAEEAGVPTVLIPATGLQPRAATGYLLRAVAALMGEVQILDDLAVLGRELSPAVLRSPGEALAGRLAGRWPLIYASTANYPLAYCWKIKFNETAKIPAFAGAVPEHNHNELEGVATNGADFYTLILRDSADDERLLKRFEVLERLYDERGIQGETIEFTGNQSWEKIFASLTLADWTALALAQTQNLDPESVPVIEAFKRALN